jgi:hypothetical protein
LFNLAFKGRSVRTKRKPLVRIAAGRSWGFRASGQAVQSVPAAHHGCSDSCARVTAGCDLGTGKHITILGNVLVETFATPMPRSDEPRKSPWVSRASTWQFVAVAFLCGFGVWLCSAGLAILAANHKVLTVRTMQTVDVLVGILVAFLVLRILLASRVRHQRIIRNLEIIAEMNHHIRNALVGLQLAAYLSHNKQTIDHIRESSSHIEWALRELLPKSGDE